MDNIQRGLITLVRSSLTGEVLSLPEGFDWETAYPQIRRHEIYTMAYEGAVCCGVDKKLPVMQKLFQYYLKCFLHSEKQLEALARVCDALEENGFDHLLLKGSVLKAFYPKPELRLMGDADILIRKEQYESIRPIMQGLGFRETEQGFYDYGWKSSDLYVELHHCLSNPYNTDFNSYLGDGWLRAKKSEQGERRFEYTAEDHFIYLFVHFTKHYRDGGIGLRHAADLWVHKKANPDLDETYLMNELEKMNLGVFYTNVQRMLSVWFEDAPEDDVSDFITETVFNSGAFGTSDVIRKAVALRAANKMGSEKRAKIWRVFRMLFPGRIAMQRRYPVLKKYPWLLPFLWPIRWLSACMFRRDNIRRQREYTRETSEENIQKYRQALNYVGLDYTVKD